MYSESKNFDSKELMLVFNSIFKALLIYKATMNKIQSYVAMLALGAVVSACGSGNNGELVGVPDRPRWSQQEPYGTVFVPQGTFQVGQADEDVFFNQNQISKTVSIKAFYMDDAEISNNEYRQFVFWVRDSLAHTILGNTIEDEFGKEYIDWNIPLDWSDPILLEEVQELFFPENEQIFGRFELDTRKLNFTWKYFDICAAADNRDNARLRSEFLKTKAVNVYPDTLVWRAISLSRTTNLRPWRISLTLLTTIIL